MMSSYIKSTVLLLAICVSVQIKATEIPVRNARVENNTFVWEVTAVEFRDDCTIVSKQVTPKTNGTWITSSYDEFLEDTNTNRRFKIKWSSIGFNEPKTLYSTDPVSFTEIYEPVGDARRININSGSEYYIKAIDTKPYYTSYPSVGKPYNGAYCKTVITAVVISSECTLIALDYYSYYDEGWVSFASNMMIRNVENNFMAQISHLLVCDENGRIVDEKNLDERYNVKKGERNRVILVFPRTPTGIHSLDIIESDGFFWYGVKINNVD